jgi:hypothetical protein
MKVIPCTISRAKEIVREHHRHNRPPVSGLFALAAELDGVMIGVAIVGRPVARRLQDGITAEVTRTCTLPGAPKGTVSFLYSACRRVAWASDPDDDFKGMYGTSKPAPKGSTNAQSPEPPKAGTP